MTDMYSTLCTFNKTPPLPADVEREFVAHAGDDLTALAWLQERGIDSAPERAALIQYGLIWNPESSRYDFRIYPADHIGPKRRPALAVPIYEDGVFTDLLLIGDFISFDDGEPDDRYFETACCRAQWLGRGNLSGPVVRLHAHPIDWIEAGCTGVCHIEPIGRKALAELQAATTIQCNDIETALEAWDWGFESDDDALARFVIDDTPGNISAYYEDDFKWRTASKEARS